MTETFENGFAICLHRLITWLKPGANEILSWVACSSRPSVPKANVGC